MNWSTFLTSVDWPTWNDEEIDFLIECLMMLRIVDRMEFLRTFEKVDQNKRPKGFEEVVVDLKAFMNRENAHFVRSL